MFGRLLRDESGMAMGLAIITVVLIGVMGAGLLVFVRNDLETVVEVNQGQQAFEIADAGVQAAKRQLLSDANRRHYDLDYSNDCGSADTEDFRLTGEDWSPSSAMPNANCTSSTPKSSIGVAKNFASGRFVVTIRCYDQTSDATDVCSGVNETAPENIGASKKAFFKVTSTGYYPADGSGARRTVEAILNTKDMGVPRAYYTPNNIDIKGSACIDSVSLFALGNVTLAGGGNGCGAPNKENIRGKETVYGNWLSSSNPTARGTDDAGIGAVGTIDSGLKVAGRDYDKNTCPKFVQSLSESSAPCPSKITFPFDQASMTSQRDADRMQFLLEEAKRQEAETNQTHYFEYSGGTSSLTSWPANSSANTVVFVRFTGGSSNTLKWMVSGSCSDNPPKQGTLVIQNGNFTTQPSKALFRGVVIVRGGEYLDDPNAISDGTSTDTGNTCLDGFVNASGTVTIAGSAEPIASKEVSARPGFYGVELWSWRECYSINCN